MHVYYLLKSFRILLFPFSLIYWLAVFVRNLLYDFNFLPSTSFGLPVICVGNLSVGGTRKSPIVEYLAEKLKSEFRIAILSRGYKRRTKGYTLAGEGSTALEIGDEPMQFHLKFPDLPVAVGEERMDAIPQLLHDRPGTECIILDDAFQHRAVKAGINLLLTDYHRLFTRDFYLPAGNLRDLKSSYKRADLILVTKCPPGLTIRERNQLISEIRPLPNQQVFFTANKYSHPYQLVNPEERIHLKRGLEVLLVTGIANPRPLKDLLEEIGLPVTWLQYPDHHIFTIDDWDDIKKKFDALPAGDKIILTTEKDAVRLIKFRNKFGSAALYVVPLRHSFLFEGEPGFLDLIRMFIRDFRKIN